MFADEKMALGRNALDIESTPSGLAIVKTFVGERGDSERRYANSRLFADTLADRIDSPKLLEYDDESLILKYEYLFESKTLFEFVHDAASTSWPPAHDALMHLCNAGRLLGKLHSLPVPPEASTVAAQAVRIEPTFARRFDRLTTTEYANSSGGELEAWRIFQHDKRLRDAVSSTFQRVQRPTQFVLVHGDVRPDQFLVEDSETYLIDWEEFGLGSAGRDLAGLVGALVFEALELAFGTTRSSNTGPAELHSQYVDSGVDRLTQCGTAIESVFDGYREHAIPPAMDALTSYVGLYLFERVIGRAMLQSRLTAIDRAIAGVARTALIEPDALASVLGKEAS